MKNTVVTIQQMKEKGEKISMLTAYDYSTAKLEDEAGVNTILVGDSLGNVILGYEDTISVTMEDMIHHGAAVARGAKNALVVVDMPFMSYQTSVYDAVVNAGRLMKEGRAGAVKLEGGKEVCPQIQAIVGAGIPVCAHLGLTPQSINAFGGFKVQGKTEKAAKKLIADAIAVQEAGAFAVVLEGIPSKLANLVTEKLDIPTIGIGAGNGRVLLVDDEIMIREGFKKLFDWEAHECVVVGEAADGMEAITKIDEEQPDIVIMDINIPIINGLKVIQLSRVKYPSMAFVIVSGYDDFSYCREALRLQITDYILKPVNYEEFGSCIDRLKISLYNNEVKEKPVVKKERVITGITKYMQEHLSEDVSLHILSEEFHLNSQYISQLFKNEIGVNFLTYLTNIRMEHAKKLLLSTSLSIAEVSEQSGYGDYRVFTKVFKKSEGITPSQYRRDFLFQ